MQPIYVKKVVVVTVSYNPFIGLVELIQPSPTGASVEGLAAGTSFFCTCAPGWVQTQEGLCCGPICCALMNV